MTVLGVSDLPAEARTISATFPGWCHRDADVSFQHSMEGLGTTWANGVSMATPIAHKGVIAGAKVASDDDARHSVAPGTCAESLDYSTTCRPKTSNTRAS